MLAPLPLALLAPGRPDASVVYACPRPLRNELLARPLFEDAPLCAHRNNPALAHI